MIGSPEPPPPFRARPAFERLSFTLPLYVAAEPGSNRLLVVEQAGRIVAFENDSDVSQTDLFCELADHDNYSLTFHPRYVENGLVYVFANGPNLATVKDNKILCFHVPPDAPRRCDPASRTVIIEWPSNGHNGGEMAFGPDGMLYISSGDGTSDSDGDVTGQKISDLTSGILRIDVDHPDPGRNYSVPPDNPFLDLPDARPELWAYGFRNPWRMTFEPATGELLVGDIGQDLWELIHLVRRGGNSGWSVVEGTHPFHSLRELGPHSVVPPLKEHHHSESRSITGGIVYTGSRFPDLAGAYLYGDYSTGKVWGLRHEGDRVTWSRELADTPLQILGFCQDAAGEVYLVDYVGAIQRLEPTPPVEPGPPFPRRLSETGLFESVAEHRPQEGLIPYEVNSPLWSDGTLKERFIGLPGESWIDFTETGAWKLPELTVLVKTFSLELSPGDAASRRRVETRLLKLEQGEWQGFSYLWNDEQTDAELVAAAGAERPFAIQDATAQGGARVQTWHYPSRAECMVCHSRAAGFVLGLNTPQMNRINVGGGRLDCQLASIADRGAFRVDLREHGKALKARIEGAALILAAVAPAGSPRIALRGALDLAAALSVWPFPIHVRQLAGELQSEFSRGLERRPVHVGWLPQFPLELPRLADPADPRASLDARARSYLHANCAQCHAPAGGGNSAIDLQFSVAAREMRLIGERPLHDRYAIEGGLLVAPGDPEHSILLHRVAKLGPGRMPPLASSVVDESGAALLREWIAGLESPPAEEH